MNLEVLQEANLLADVILAIQSSKKITEENKEWPLRTDYTLSGLYGIFKAVSI